MTELTEQFDFDFSESTVSEDDAFVTSVCLCGNESKNGRRYPPSSFGDASVYNDRPVFLSHGIGFSNRDVRDLAGTIESASIKNGKPYGVIRFTELEAGKSLRSVAKSRLKNVGMSHKIKCKTNKDETVVEQVEEVVSVDLVCFPATTKSLSEEVEDMTDKTVEVLLEKQIATLQTERDASIKELSEQKTAHGLLAKDALEKVSELEGSVNTLEAEVDTFRTEKALTERRTAIGTELKEAELNTEDKALVSDTFVEHLMSEPDSVKRKALIADRKAVRESAGKHEQVVTQQRTSAPASSFDTEKAFGDVYK